MVLRPDNDSPYMYPIRLYATTDELSPEETMSPVKVKFRFMVSNITEANAPTYRLYQGTGNQPVPGTSWDQGVMTPDEWHEVEFEGTIEYNPVGYGVVLDKVLYVRLPEETAILGVDQNNSYIQIL